MLAIIALFGSLFYYENSEFFHTSKEQRTQGYEWEYIGKKERHMYIPALPLIIEETNEEIVYFKLNKNR
jgi:hypothetical protein